MKGKLKLKAFGAAILSAVGVVLVSGCTTQQMDILSKMINFLMCILASGGITCAGVLLDTQAFSASDVSVNADVFGSEGVARVASSEPYVRQSIENSEFRADYWVANDKVVSLSIKPAGYKDKTLTMAQQRSIGEDKSVDAKAIYDDADKSLIKDTADSLKWLRDNKNKIGLTEEQKAIISSQDLKFNAQDFGNEIKLTFESGGKSVVLWADKETKKIVRIGEEKDLKEL